MGSISTFLKILERELPHGIPIPKLQQGEEDDDDDYYNLHTILHSNAGIVSTKTIEYFPQDLLSYDPKKRLNQLFQKCSKWKHCDLLPYVYPLVDDNDGATSSVNVILDDCTRIVKSDDNDDDIVMYVSK